MVLVVVTYLIGSFSSWPFLTCFTVCSVWYVLLTVRFVCVYSDLCVVCDVLLLEMLVAPVPFLCMLMSAPPGDSLLYRFDTYIKTDFLSGRSRTISENVKRSNLYWAFSSLTF